MRALIRDPGETVTEKDGLTFINWDTGAPLTNPEWFGGPYRLVLGYVAPAVAEDPEPSETAPAPAPTQEPETVTIDGKEYTKEELLAILNQTA